MFHSVSGDKVHRSPRCIMLKVYWRLIKDRGFINTFVMIWCPDNNLRVKHTQTENSLTLTKLSCVSSLNTALHWSKNLIMIRYVWRGTNAPADWKRLVCYFGGRCHMMCFVVRSGRLVNGKWTTQSAFTRHISFTHSHIAWCDGIGFLWANHSYAQPSGAMQGSVSGPRTLRHAGLEEPGLEPQLPD